MTFAAGKNARKVLSIYRIHRIKHVFLAVPIHQSDPFRLFFCANQKKQSKQGIT